MDIFITCLLMLVIPFLLFALAVDLFTPDGWEDENGFHKGKR